MTAGCGSTGSCQLGEIKARVVPELIQVTQHLLGKDVTENQDSHRVSSIGEVCCQIHDRLGGNVWLFDCGIDFEGSLSVSLRRLPSAECLIHKAPIIECPCVLGLYSEATRV